MRYLIVHARIAVLEGLSPKENRDIPPLKPDWVYALKTQFPGLNISINGGIKTFEEIDHHLQYVDGVMLGREAYQNPYLLSEVDGRLYGCQQPVKSRAEVIEKMLPYIESELAREHGSAILPAICWGFITVYPAVVVFAGISVKMPIKPVPGLMCCLMLSGLWKACNT